LLSGCYRQEVFWFPKVSRSFHLDSSLALNLAVDSKILRVQFQKHEEILSMLKKVFLIAAAALALALAGSAEIPVPPCNPCSPFVG
jgi:hypothetical protein